MCTYESGCAPKERYCYRSVVLQLKLPRLDMSDRGRKPAVGEAYEWFESTAPLTPVENPKVRSHINAPKFGGPGPKTTHMSVYSSHLGFRASYN